MRKTEHSSETDKLDDAASELESLPQSGAAKSAIEHLEPDIAFLVRTLEGIYRSRSYPVERAHYLLLLRLMEGARNSSQLATELALDHSTITRQIAAMDQRGYVIRRPNPADGRSALIEISEEGRAKCSEMRIIRQQRLAHLLEDWRDEEKVQFSEMIARFNGALLTLEKGLEKEHGKKTGKSSKASS